MTILTNKELTVIDRIGANGGVVTQRQIAEHAGLSLGLTNLILKKLAKTGYIKIKQLNPKKMHYILTSKGIAEKAKKSYHYVIKTIKEMKNIQNCAERLFSEEIKSGNKKIGIIGENELTELIRFFSQRINDVEITWLGEDPNVSAIKEINLLIDCRNEEAKKEYIWPIRTIIFVDYLLNTQILQKEKSARII